MAQQWLMLIMNLIVAVLSIVLVALATRLRSNAGSVGAGLVTLTTLASTLSTIVVAYTGLETSLGAISRLTTFIDQTEQEVRGDERRTPDKTWPDRGCIEFHNVVAEYTIGTPVLRDFDLRISAKEKIAICGRTGR